MVFRQRRSFPKQSVVLLYALFLNLSYCYGQAIDTGRWQQKALFTAIFRRAWGEIGQPRTTYQRDSGATCQPVVFVLVDPASSCLTIFAADLPRLG